MGMPSMDPESWMQRFRQRLDALEAENRRMRAALGLLENATIGKRGLTVKDAGLINIEGGALVAKDDDGSPQVRVGALTNGGYGLEQRIGSSWVPLAGLAGGAKAAGFTGSVSMSAPDSLGSSAWNTGYGPSVTYTTYTGRAIIVLVCARAEAAFAAGLLGYRLTGAQSVTPDNDRSARLYTKDEINGSLVYATLLDGDPGEVTLTMAYRALGTQSAYGGSVSFAARTAIVLPF